MTVHVARVKVTNRVLKSHAATTATAPAWWGHRRSRLHGDFSQMNENISVILDMIENCVCRSRQTQARLWCARRVGAAVGGAQSSSRPVWCAEEQASPNKKKPSWYLYLQVCLLSNELFISFCILISHLNKRVKKCKAERQLSWHWRLLPSFFIFFIFKKEWRTARQWGCL